MSAEVVIELRMPDWARLSERVQAEVPGLIAATLQTQRGMIFRSGGSYNGRPGWAPLRCRDGQPLRDRGTLSQSIGPVNDGLHPSRVTGSIVRLSGGLNGVVTIGTSLAYAAVQNYGATIVPVRAKALRFMCHGKVVFRKKVVIPPRPFADFTGEDERELVTTIENYLQHLIGGS